MQVFFHPRLLFKCHVPRPPASGITDKSAMTCTKLTLCLMITHDKFYLTFESLLTAIIKLSELCKFLFMISFSYF
jgi:hypothetical protein